jgi:rSAM/selenodomain-associated transferase 1
VPRDATPPPAAAISPLPTAVAVMAKVPGATPAKSRLQPPLSAVQAVDLYRCFLLDRLEALAAVPDVDRIVAFTPAGAAPAMAALAPRGFRCLPQQGDGLGQRLQALFAALFAVGHRAVIAMDSDSPTLPMARVADAARALEAGDDAVIGPSDDGGYYLIGLRATRPELFDDVPWSTPAVLATTLARARTLGLRVRLLSPWYDVDTEPDLRRLQRDLRAHPTAPRTRVFLQSLDL